MKANPTSIPTRNRADLRDEAQPATPAHDRLMTSQKPLRRILTGLATAFAAFALGATSIARADTLPPELINLASATGVFLADTAAGGDGTLANTGWENANSYYDGGGLGFSVLTDGTSDTKWIGCGTEAFGVSYPGPDGHGAGFYFTLPTATAMQSIQFFTQDSAPLRSPATMTIEGSNAVGADLMLGTSWTLLYSGQAGLGGIGENSAGATVNFGNTTAYTSYRVLFPTIYGNQGVQLADIAAYTPPTPVGTTPTTTTLAANTNTNPSIYGDSLSFDVTVAEDGGTRIPTGTVTLKDGGPTGTTLGSAPLTGGACTITTTTLAGGTHANIVAVYSGNSTFAGSFSSALSPAQVVKAALIALYRFDASATADIDGASKLGAYNGITFDGTGVGTPAVSGGALVLDGSSTVNLNLGSVVATNPLDATHNASIAIRFKTSAPLGGLLASGQLWLTVHGGEFGLETFGNRMFSAGTDLDDGNWHTAVFTYDALKRFYPLDPYAQLLYVDGTTAVADPSGDWGAPGWGSNTGAAAVTLGISGGDYNNTQVKFNGEIDYVAFFSGTLTSAEVANIYAGDFGAYVKVTTTTTLARHSDTSTPSAYGATLSFDVTVAEDGGPGIPTGTVTLKDGGTTIGTGELVDGTCTITTTALAVGTHANIVAVYSGDPTFAGSTSSALSPAQAVNLPAGAKLAFTTQPGTDLVPQPVVTVQDALDNTLDCSASITLAIKTGTGPGTLSGTNIVEAVNGVATFTGLSIDLAGAAYQLTATSAGLTPADSEAFSCTTVRIGAEQYNPGGGDTLPSPIDVSSDDLLQTSLSSVTGDELENMRDGSFISSTPFNDNPFVTTYALNLINNPGGYDIREVRVFSGWDSTRSPQSYDMSYSLVGAPDTFLPLGTVLTAAGESGAIMTRTYDATGAAILTGVAKIQFSFRPNTDGTVYREIDVIGTPTSPGGTTATTTTLTRHSGMSTPSAYGATLSFDVTVAEDGGPGIPTGTVTLKDGGSTGTTLGSAPLTGGACTITTTTLTVGTHANIVAVYSGDSTFAGSNSSALDPAQVVNPGAPAQLAFTTQPGGGQPGVVWGTQPVVTVQDAFGNTVTNSTASITLAITEGTPTSGGPGTLGGTKTVAAENGVATFSDLSIDTAGAAYQLTATSGSLTSADSTAFTVEANLVSELLSNGSFEIGDPAPPADAGQIKVVAGDTANLPGWTASAEMGWYFKYAAWGMTAPDGAGERLFNLINAAGANVLSQSFAVAAGTTYTVSYYEMKRGGGGYMTTTLSVAEGTVTGAGGAPVAVGAGPATSIVQTTGANAAWTLHSFKFTPNTSTTATLAFGNDWVDGDHGDRDGVFLDNISVIETKVSTTTLAANTNTNPSNYGDLLSFGVTVSGDAGTPTGTVTLKDGGPTGTPLGSVTLTDGACTITTTTLSGGTHNNIVAVYSGDFTYATSTSAVASPAQVVVNLAGPTITAKGSPLTVALTTIYGTASPATSFTVSGVNMAAGITVTPPAGIEVSQTAGGASGYAGSGNPITVGSTGTIGDTLVYVRLAANAPVTGTYNAQNIVLSSLDAIFVNVLTKDSGNGVSKADSSVTDPMVGTYTYNTTPQGPDSGSTATGSTGPISYSYRGTSSAGGTYGPSGTRPTAAGYYTVIATVAADDNHNAASSTETPFMIGMADPVVSTWPTATIAYGQTLGSSTFSGGSATPAGGTYAFSSPTTKPPVGTATHAATYTPADTDNYNQASGSVSVTVTPKFASWIDGFNWTGFSNPDKSATGDPDHDGLTNEKEYAFGLLPNNAASCDPITVQLNKTTGKFSYTRTATPATTGITYSVWTSTSLAASGQPGGWAEDVTAAQSVISNANNVETVEVTLSGTKPLGATKLFVQVKAVVPAQ